MKRIYKLNYHCSTMLNKCQWIICTAKFINTNQIKYSLIFKVDNIISMSGAGSEVSKGFRKPLAIDSCMGQ